jgi:hypothetical protein
MLREKLPLDFQAAFHVRVCSFYQIRERSGIDLAFRHEFYMTHELAGTFQQTVRVGDLGATKEANIHVGFERIDIAERRIVYTRSWMSIVQ